ncbi:MAG: M42 family metallopeptidase [Chloroflexi bacterium]|nr:M42 family metallopeptidase [Chloroflexota bacterium]
MSEPIDHRSLALLLERLSLMPGLSGHEDLIARALADHLAPYAATVRIDPLANVIAHFDGAAESPRVAVLAHIDTVGLLVNRCHSDGTLGVVAVGGVNLAALPGTPVRVGEHPGVITVRAQHLARPDDAILPIEAIAIRVGVDPAAVEITTPVLYATQPAVMGDLYTGPYLDNRAGCAVLVELARRLAESPPPYSVDLIGTVQEETTCAGANSVLHALRPDAAIFVDGTLSYDARDVQHLGPVRLGHGPVLTSFLYVSGLNGWHAHPGLRAHLKQVAAAHDIPFQQDAVRGLISDARVAGWLGIPSAIIGLPLEAKHAPYEIAHLGDLAHAIDLLLAALHAPLPDLSRG